MDSHAPIPSVPGVVDPRVPDPPDTSPPPGALWQPPASYSGNPRLHPWEIPLLVFCILLGIAVYTIAVVAVFDGGLSDLWLLVLVAPLLVVVMRGMLYAQLRTSAVKLTPTQFPEGYAMVVEAAARYGLEYVPDGFVVQGGGQINAFASGHGFRRFVAINSDLFEIGGKARDPDALRFIVGHEVGHIAAGHTSYWRMLSTYVAMALPIIGTTLSRAQEYTADNYGYYNQPSGSPGAIGVMAAGKYMLSAVAFDEFADRATRERGFFVWLVNVLATHPVLTWRAAALRDRTRRGALLWWPRQATRGIGSGNTLTVATPEDSSQVPDGTLPNGMIRPRHTF